MDEQRKPAIGRREMLRRTAVVGANLLWVAPAVQTLAPKAFAQTGSPVFGCCECRAGSAGRRNCNGLADVQCVSSGAPTASESACAQYCASLGKAYCFHVSPTAVTCVTIEPGNSPPRSACSSDRPPGND